jgi:hypothetical protein
MTFTRHSQALFRLIVPVLALLFAWAVFVRNIGLESLWYDENISWWLATRPTLGELLAQWPLGTGHPPLYFLSLWGWIRWAGSVDLTVMRLSAVIPMLLAVAFVYRLGREWFGSRWAGLAAMLMLATTGVTVYYARELRMYGLLVLLAVISWWLLRRFVECGRRRTLVAYAVVVALMAYTHYLAAMLAAAQALVVLLLYRRRFPALLAGYMLTALLVAPWLPTFIAQQEAASFRAGQVGAIGQFNATEPTTWDNIGDFVTLYSAGQISFVAALLAVGIALGLSRANAAAYRRRVVMTALWLFAPVVLVLVVNLAVPLFNPRYVQWIIPALALLAGVAVAQIPARGRLPLLLVIALSGVVTHTAAFDAPKIPHRELLTAVDTRFQPGDRLWYNLNVGALGSTTGEEVRYYLQEVVPELGDEDFVWDAPKDISDPTVTRLWDVRPYFNPMPDVAADALDDGWVQTEETAFGAYFLRLYERVPGDDAPAAWLGDVFAVTPRIEAQSAAAGAPLPVVMWWRALLPPALDYSYVLVLRDAAGNAVTQWDGGLLLDEAPTSGWSVDEGYGLVSVTVPLPENLPPGDYTLWAGAYYWEDPVRLPVSADAGVMVDDGAGLVQVGVVLLP